ncbi:MAG: cobalamin-binding protein, partial [Deltaproteobacteria bacterium]
IVIFPCGYPISKTIEELKSSNTLRQFSQLRAYFSGKVFVCDGNQYFNRPGPRIVDSCEILASLFYPEKFKSPHESYRWSFEETIP